MRASFCPPLSFFFLKRKPGRPLPLFSLFFSSPFHRLAPPPTPAGSTTRLPWSFSWYGGLRHCPLPPFLSQRLPTCGTPFLPPSINKTLSSTAQRGGFSPFLVAPYSPVVLFFSFSIEMRLLRTDGAQPPPPPLFPPPPPLLNFPVFRFSRDPFPCTGLRH